jgi:hypothetical protein
MSVEGECTNDSVVDLTEGYKEVVTPVSKARNYYASTQIVHYPIWPKGTVSRRDVGTTEGEEILSNYGEFHSDISGVNNAQPQTKSGFGMIDSRDKRIRGDSSSPGEDNFDKAMDLGFSALSIIHKFKNTIRKACSTSLTRVFDDAGAAIVDSSTYKEQLGFDADEMHFMQWLTMLGLELEFGKDAVDSDHWHGVGPAIHGATAHNNEADMGTGKLIGKLTSYDVQHIDEMISAGSLATSNYGQMCDFATPLMKMASDWATFTSLSNVKSRYQWEEHFFTGLAQLFTMASFEVGQYAATKGFWWRELVKVAGDTRRVAQLDVRDPDTYTASILKSELGDDIHNLSISGILGGSTSELEYVSQLNEGATFGVVKQAYEKGLAMGGVDSVIQTGRDEDGNPTRVRFVFLPYLPMGSEGNFWGGSAETDANAIWTNFETLVRSDTSDIKDVADTLSDYPLGVNLKTDFLFGNNRGALASLSECMKAYSHAYVRQRGRFNVFAQSVTKNFDEGMSLHNALLTKPTPAYQNAWLAYLTNNVKLHNVSNGAGDNDNYSWLAMHNMPMWDREQYYSCGIGPRGPHKVNVVNGVSDSATMAKQDCLDKNNPVWTTMIAHNKKENFDSYASEYMDICTLMDMYSAVLPTYDHAGSESADEADRSIGTAGALTQSRAVNDVSNKNPFKDMVTIICDDSEFEADVPFSASSLIYTGQGLTAGNANLFTVEDNAWVHLNKPTIRMKNWDRQNDDGLGKWPIRTASGRTAASEGDERYYDYYREGQPSDSSLGLFLWGEDAANNLVNRTNAMAGVQLLNGWAPLAKFGYTGTRNAEWVINDTVETKYGHTDKPLKMITMSWLLGNIEHSVDSNNKRDEWSDGQGSLMEIDGPGAGLWGRATHMGTHGDGASINGYDDTDTTGHMAAPLPTVTNDYAHLQNHDIRRSFKELHYLEYYWRKYATKFGGSAAQIYVSKSVTLPPLSRIRKFMGSLFGYDTEPPFWHWETIESALGMQTPAEEESAIVDSEASPGKTDDSNPPIGDKIDTEAETEKAEIEDSNPPIGDKKSKKGSSGTDGLSESEKKDSSPGEDGGEVVGKIGDKTVRKKKGESPSEAFKRVKGKN